MSHVEGGTVRARGAAWPKVDRDLLALLIDDAPIGVVLLDLEGRIVRANTAFGRFLAHDPDDLTGRHVVEFTHPEDLETLFGRIELLRTTPGSVDQSEARCVRDDGTVVWGIIGISAVPGPEGRPAFLLARVQDITERRRAEEALQESEKRFRSLVQHSSDLIVVCDGEGVRRHVSPSSARILGIAPERLVGRSGMAGVHRDDRPAVRAAFDRAISEPGTPATVTCRMRHADGSWRHLEAVLTNLVDDPEVGALMVNARDVTERHAAEEHLAAQTRILEMIACDRPLHETIRELTALVESRVERGRCTILLAGDDVPPPRLDLTPGPTPAVAGPDAPGARCSVPILSSSGDEVLGTLTLHLGRVGPPGPVDQQLLDNSAHLAQIAVERTRSRAQLAYQALHDPLTGLPNRALFLDRLAGALDRSARRRTGVAVLFLDVDRFKIVNDSLGHPAGDRLLVALARRLRDALLPGDTLARFGGDEFTILCEEVGGGRDAAAIARLVSDLLAAPFSVGEQEVFLTVSIGIAVAGTSADGPEGLLRDADVALFRAKERGRSRHEVFDEEMRDRAVERLRTENALRRAIDRGELRLHYQPEVRLRDGRTFALEALLRWEHPDRGLLFPRDFLAFAEETGLIVPIGEWVLEEACRQVAAWRGLDGDDLGPVVWVNLSPRQLADPGLVTAVERALSRAGLPPDRLCLEITESALLEDAESVVAMLWSLKALGVRLAVDDFGTGYSSLSYLSRFPVDALKVDRSFVHAVADGPEDSAIVAAVLGLGRALGLTVVAEGVETPEQLERLRALGCEMGQGYWFAMPQPAAAIEVLLRAGGVVPASAATG